MLRIYVQTQTTPTLDSSARLGEWSNTLLLSWDFENLEAR
jgi:hypothetical protein